MFEYINYSPKMIDSFDLNNLDNIREQCFWHCISKYESKYNITIINEPSSINAVMVAFVIDKCNISFPNSDLPEKVYNANAGDIFSFHSLININASNKNNIILFSYKYLEEKRKHGNGNKVFEINTKLEDLYKLDVYANTLEEAIEFAKNTDILYWQHLDLYPEITTNKKITRYSKWHLFFGKEKK